MNKQSIFLILATIILGTAGFFYITHTSVSQKSIAPQYNTWQEARQAWLAYLDALENELWQELASLGISKEFYNEKYAKDFNMYFKNESPFSTEPVSQQTKEFTQSILKYYGVNPSSIGIYAFNDPSPAIATDKFIYINEKVFNTLAQSSKKFVIAHEIQHCIHQDNSRLFTLEKILGKTVEELAKEDNPNHILLKFSRFIEHRADLKAALHDNTIVEAYLLYTQERFNVIGETRGLTHPKNSSRLQFAHALHDSIKGTQPSVIT